MAGKGVELTTYGKFSVGALNSIDEAPLCQCINTVDLWSKNKPCKRKAKLEIEGKLYCKPHGNMKIFDMIFISKTHRLEKII